MVKKFKLNWGIQIFILGAANMCYPSEQDIISVLISALMKDYPSILLDVIFTDDLYSEALNVCESPEYLSFLQSLPVEEQVKCRDLNGMYIQPKDINGKQYILVSNKQRKDGYSYISTVAHEAQHAINHSLFALDFCNNEFNQIYSHTYNTAFQIWDEFAARRTGHRVFTTIVMPNYLGYSTDEIKDQLKNSERVCRLKEIDLLREQPVSLEIFKNIAGILAMLSVWEQNFYIELEELDEWGIKFLRCLDGYASSSEVDYELLHKKLSFLWDTIGQSHL
jgi:hypothetical protein